jgi:hypothetical protein
MVSLVDIVPQARSVPINGGDLVLRGLGLRQIANLLLRFPSLRNLLTEGAPELDVETLLLMAPEAIGAIIAEAADQPDAAATIPDTMSIEDVAACLLMIRDLTMPGGPAPFFALVARLINAAAPSGRVPDTTSPPMPNGSSPPDIHPAT